MHTLPGGALRPLRRTLTLTLTLPPTLTPNPRPRPNPNPHPNPHPNPNPNPHPNPNLNPSPIPRQVHCGHFVLSSCLIRYTRPEEAAAPRKALAPRGVSCAGALRDNNTTNPTLTLTLSLP